MYVNITSPTSVMKNLNANMVNETTQYSAKQLCTATVQFSIYVGAIVNDTVQSEAMINALFLQSKI